MEFAISIPGQGVIEISSTEFARAESARQNLVRVLFIEDKFDLVLANYVEFERELLDLTLQRMVYGDLTWSVGHDDIQDVNRRIANLLSACRLYTDQVAHDVAQLQDAEPSLADSLKTKFAEQYDAKLGYRAMASLRNYAQHRALPVHALIYPGAWKNLDSGPHCVFSVVVPKMNLTELHADPSFKQPVLAELATVGSSIPLTPLIREYVEGLSIAQGAFRDLIAKDLGSWEDTFHWVWRRAAEAFAGARKSVELVAFGESGRVSNREQIFEDVITQRNKLVAKNPVLTNLSLRFVSGACDLREE